MPRTPESSANELVGILPERLRKGLTLSEGSLLNAVVVGEEAKCGGEEEIVRPRDAEKWGKERVIRSDLIRWLCTDADALKKVDASGIRIDGAKFNDELDLSGLNLPFPLKLTKCRLFEGLSLEYIKMPSLCLSGSQLESLSARYADVRGSAELDRGFSCEAVVDVSNAKIGADLSFAWNSSVGGLEAGLATIGGDVVLGGLFSAKGAVGLSQARIVKDLICTNGSINVSDGQALNAIYSVIGGDVLLDGGFKANGQVSLRGAHISGDLNCERGEFHSSYLKISDNVILTDEPAIDAESAVVGGDVLLGAGFSVLGPVTFVGAQISGDLDCNKGRFKRSPSSDLEVLNAERAQIRGTVHLGQGFTSNGGVNLLRTHIGEDLDCSGGTIQNPNGAALVAEGAEIGGHTLLAEGFSAGGEVRLVGAQIKGNLDCRNASFRNNHPEESALDATSAVIGGDLFFARGFKARGPVLLLAAQLMETWIALPENSKSRMGPRLMPSGLPLTEPFCFGTDSRLRVKSICGELTLGEIWSAWVAVL